MLQLIRRRDRRSLVDLREGAGLRRPANDDAVSAAEPGKPTIVLLSWLAIAVRLARADGTLNREELGALQRLFPSAELPVWIKAALKDKLQPACYARRLAGFSDRPRAVAEALFPGLFTVAVADGHLNEAEYAVLLEASAPLEIAPLRLQRMLRSFHGRTRRPPAQVLGVEETAGREAAHKAYRALCKRLHPDALPPATPPFLKELAETRFIAIHDAYRVLSRG